MPKKNRTVTFQTDDPFEKRLYIESKQEHNFSGLMKRLYTQYLQQQQGGFLQPLPQVREPEKHQVEGPQYQKTEAGTYRSTNGGLKVNIT